MLKLEEAEGQVKEICDETNAKLHLIQTEEEAKVKIINRIFNECLGWPYADFRLETHHGNGFSDYILVEGETPVLLIEAKRMGLIEVNTAEKDKIRYLKISGSSLKASMDGIEQAASYSLSNGIPITILTDGITWIIFKTFVPGESYKSKEAVVFPSFDAVVADFSVFFDLLAKQQFGKKLYNPFFDEIHHHRLLLNQDLVAPLDGSDIAISQKSEIAFDLDRVFSNFFSRLSGEEDEDLLIECFVETRESRIADFSLEKLTRSVLGNIAPSDKDLDVELAKLVTSSVEKDASESGQTVFIVGPTGAGKTTFLDRFFRKTLPSLIRRKCVLIKVNCLDATGREDTALDWLTEQLVVGLEKEVYEDGQPDWDDLLGLYHSEYTRRAKGVDSHLYKRSRRAFKEKFSEFLDSKVESDREGYLKRILSDVVNNRKMLPILSIDNSDEFSSEYKQKFFQFSQALRRHVNHCLVIFPVTDKSAWSFSKTDIYGIYKSRSFFLPTPSPREVFRKRIDFLKLKLTEEKGEKKNRGKYFLSKGIKVSIDNLDGFAHVLESVFVDHDYTSKTLGELTNYNIRRTLLLAQRVITSSIIRIEDLIKSYISGEIVTTNYTIFMEALMKGDYEVYKQEDNHEISPIFQVDSEVQQSPLLKLRILSLLNSAYNASRRIEERHLSIQSIIDYFDSIGCSETAIDKALITLLEDDLVEPFDVSNLGLSGDQKLSITYKGTAHLILASHNSVFFFQMALTTAIANKDTALKIRSYHRSKKPFREKLESIKGEFLNYVILEDKQYVSVETEHAKYQCQKDLIQSLSKFGATPFVQDTELVAALGDEYKQGVIKKEVTVTVDFFDAAKGFGFAEIEGMDSGVYINSEKLIEFGISGINDGDEILCDIARGAKGIYIDKIHNVQDDKSNIETVDCQITRLFPERGYGFVQLEGVDRSAFFHITLFAEEIRDQIQEGIKLKADICPDRKGTGYQIKKVLKIENLKTIC